MTNGKLSFEAVSGRLARPFLIGECGLQAVEKTCFVKACQATISAGTAKRRYKIGQPALSAKLTSHSTPTRTDTRAKTTRGCLSPLLLSSTFTKVLTIVLVA